MLSKPLRPIMTLRPIPVDPRNRAFKKQHPGFRNPGHHLVKFQHFGWYQHFILLIFNGISNSQYWSIQMESEWPEYYIKLTLWGRYFNMDMKYFMGGNSWHFLPKNWIPDNITILETLPKSLENTLKLLFFIHRHNF